MTLSQRARATEPVNRGGPELGDMLMRSDLVLLLLFQGTYSWQESQGRWIL